MPFKGSTAKLSRRHFLVGSAALGLGAAIPLSIQLAAAKDNQVLVSAAREVSGNYVLVAIDLDGRLISKTSLPKRAHDALALPNKPNHVLVLARRPDTFAVEIDILQGKVTQSFRSEVGHHFYGHGVVSPDGELLYTSENAYETGQGEIVVRETSNYNIVERFSSGGIGPHELALMPDKTTLVVANGGIKTHPDWPRLKLNVDSMQPNLSYVDRLTGEVVEQVVPEHFQQSARHLIVTEQGDVYLGMQFNGDYGEQYPLVYQHQRGGQLIAMQATLPQWQSMHQYIASLCVTEKDLYVTCPRGDLVVVWDRESKALKQTLTLKDAAGLAFQNNQMLMSSGVGKLLNTNAANATSAFEETQVSNIQFDNHMTLMSLA